MKRVLSTDARRSRGFTLVEALVALLVLSIGLLGIASLQLSSLRWNHGASMRSQATLLAYDMIDRMRANQVAAANGEYTTVVGGTVSSGTVAKDDIARWKLNLANTLPSGDGSVTGPVTGEFTITVQWDDSRGAEAPLVFTMRTQI
jgi:type IV pilus assembly protein PilV